LRETHKVVLIPIPKKIIMNINAVVSVSKSPSPVTDLIEGCRTGDQKAQLQIYRLYYKSLYNLSRRILDDPFQAEEIMQESFLDAFENIALYSGTLSFGEWLTGFLRQRLSTCITENKIIVSMEINK
jgi:RNA polymerase sigma-70 factor (ECF subfamily)